MEFYIGLGVIVILIGFWNLFIAILGLFPKNLSTTVATLEKANTVRNTHGKNGRLIPVSTKYVYVYTVNGRKYRYRKENEYRRRRPLFQRMPMVYVKWFPRRAYPHKFKATVEWVFGTMFVIIGIGFLLLAKTVY